MYMKSPGKTVAGWKRTSEKEFDIRLNLNLWTLYFILFGWEIDQIRSSSVKLALLPSWSELDLEHPLHSSFLVICNRQSNYLRSIIWENRPMHCWCTLSFIYWTLPFISGGNRNQLTFNHSYKRNNVQCPWMQWLAFQFETFKWLCQLNHRLKQYKNINRDRMVPEAKMSGSPNQNPPPV